MNIRNISLAALVAALVGCAHSSAIVVGHQRPAIEPESVQVYLELPPGAERIAVLDADSGGSMAVTRRGKTNKVVQRLKEEAAAIGANGILLTGMGQQYAGSVNTGSAYVAGSAAYGTGVSVPTYDTAGGAIAIYVPSSADQALTSPAAPPGVQAAPAPTLKGGRPANWWNSQKQN